MHDAAYAPVGQTIGANGIGYAEWSESGSHDPRIYGMSYVRSDYVARAIHMAVGETARFSVFPRAIFENQNLYVVAGADVDISGLTIAAPPLASFSKAGVEAERWSGWAIDPNPGHQIVRADLFVGDRRLATVAPTPGNHAVARFFPGALNPPVSWRFAPVSVAPEAILRVEAISSAGASAAC